MKKTLKTVISFTLVTLVVLSLSSCSVFQAMRENALNAAKITIFDTPETENIANEFNTYLANSKDNAVTIKENVSYSAGRPEVVKGEEKVDFLNDSADQLKKFIMTGKPGSAEFWVKGAPADAENIKAVEDTLLNDINKNEYFTMKSDRNISSENVTDEKGNEVADDAGNVITTQSISDNTLHLTFNYFNVTNLDGEEYATDENGNATEETTVVYAEDDIVEAVFGDLSNKDDVLVNFENIKDYIVVSDYIVEYLECSISSDADLSTKTLSFVKYQKTMKVTATAKGVGALEEYGEFNIVFTLTKTVNYEFTYDETVEATADDTTTANDDATTENTSADDETTADGETTVIDESTSEDSSVQEAATDETTVAIDETTSEE